MGRSEIAEIVEIATGIAEPGNYWNRCDSIFGNRSDSIILRIPKRSPRWKGSNQEEEEEEEKLVPPTER